MSEYPELENMNVTVIEYFNKCCELLEDVINVCKDKNLNLLSSEIQTNMSESIEDLRKQFQRYRNQLTFEDRGRFSTIMTKLGINMIDKMGDVIVPIKNDNIVIENIESKSGHIEDELSKNYNIVKDELD
jgi:stress response protein YsnF